MQILLVNFTRRFSMGNHIDACVQNPLSDTELALLRAEAEKVKDEAIF